MPGRKGTDARRTIAYFDEVAHDYGDLYDQPSPTGYAFTIRRQRVLELFDSPGGDVLDVGCGPGVMVGALTDQGCGFWGVDPSAQMIDAAKAAHTSRARVHLTVGQAESLDFPDERFDAVICMGVIERLKDDDLALSEMARVLKPGGALIVTMPNRFSPALQWRDQVFYRLVALAKAVRRRRARSQPVPVRAYRTYDRRRYSAAVHRHGCDVVDVSYCVYSWVPAPLDSFMPGLTVRSMRRVEFLHRTRLRGLGGALVIKAKKREPIDA